MKNATLNFTDKEIWKMSVPLFLEQGLVMLVGMVDIALVSYAGEAAVSGVALVNQFNIIFVYLFTALATGGAVVVNQYLGKKDIVSANKAQGQLASFAAGLAVLLSIITYTFGNQLLGLLFGKVEADVFAACSTYLHIAAFSYPALAIYNAGAVIFRSLGKTKTTMYISGLANVVNVIGNFIGIFVFKAGVVGVAIPSVLSITLAATIITYLGFKQNQELHYSLGNITRFDLPMLKRILNIAVPNSLEQGIAQIVKVALTSIVAMFGTVQIAAYGVAQSIWSVAALVGIAMRPVFITIIGQCVGARNYGAADLYFAKLTKITLGTSTLWNGLILLLTPLALQVYQLDEATRDLVFTLVLLHNIFNAFAFPFSSALGTGLRATGDVKYTMYVAIGSTILVRLLWSYILGIGLNMGVLGIALAMVADWCVCGFLYYLREKAGAWRLYSVL